MMLLICLHKSFVASWGISFYLSWGDEDIRTVDTTIAPTITHIQGSLTRACARQLNYHVLLFLGIIPNIHDNMMLPKSYMFMLLRNDGPRIDVRVKH
jgi:hypothetical protein